MGQLWISIGLFVVFNCVIPYNIASPIITNSDGSSSNKTITDDTLRALLGKIKDYMSPVQALPDQKYFTNSSTLCANISSQDAVITDLTVYNIDVAHADMENLIFMLKLTFPVVNVTGLYNLYAENDIFVIRGHGNLRADLKDLSLAANLTLSLNSNNTLEMKNVTSDFDFSFAQVNLENLGENKDVSVFLNDFINQFIAESMKSLKPTFEEMSNERMISFGNFLVQSMTLDEFVDFINGLL